MSAPECHEGPDGSGEVPPAHAAYDGRRAGSPLALLQRYREPLLYLVVGGWNTVFGYAVFALLYWLLNAQLPSPVIVLLAYVIAVVNNFLCYKLIVFRTRGGYVREVLRFAVVYVPVLAANMLVLPLALRTLPLNAYAIQAIYTSVVVVASYLGLKFFTFRRR